MDNVVTTSAMEAFLLNPTEMSDRYAESPSLALKTRRRSDPLASNTGKRTLHQSKESFSDPLVEQLYWRRYDSDEEALSSAESDTESIDSASSGEILEMTTARLSIVSAEELARSCHPIEQSIYCAQAVYLQPVNRGNAKLSPRLVEIPPSPRFERSQNMGYYKPSMSRLSKLDTSTATRHHRSVASTPRSSLENSSNASTSSTPPTSVDDRSPVSSSEKVIRRKSAVSSMRSVAKREFSINSHNMPDAQTLREFLASAPSTQDRPLSQVPAHLTTPSKRKLRKFSSSFSLGRFNPSFTKRNSSAGNLLEEMPALPAKYATPPMPEVYRPTRCSSLLPPPPTKMVARGGNERATPIVLPPCPNDSEDDGARVGPVRGHLQRSPKSYSPTGAPKTGRKLHRRQRSLSADDIMMASS
jgi:hypothetical protein